MLIQKLRLQHGWSQQQLAEASGLSVRTIQRLEAGQPASIESLKSLAAVFEIDYVLLNTEQAMETKSEVSKEEQAEVAAFDYVRRLKGFYLHLTRYVAVIALLFVINAVTSPNYWWAFWPMLGWGIGIAMHGLKVFGRDWPLGPDWERRQVERRLGRPLA